MSGWRVGLRMRTHCQGSNPGTQAASYGAQAPAQIEAQVTQQNPARHNPSNHSQKKSVNPSNKWLPNFHEPTISVDQLEQELVNHPDKAFTDYLTSGCRNGFDVGLSEYPSVPYFCRNNLSARNDPIKTTELINDELRKGYLIGPFNEPPFEVYRINPISLAQKNILIRNVWWLTCLLPIMTVKTNLLMSSLARKNLDCPISSSRRL